MKRLIKPATWIAVVGVALLLVAAAAARRRPAVASAAPPAPEVSVLAVVPETVVARYESVEQVDPIYVNFSPSDEDLLRLRRDIADGRLVMPPAPHALAVQVTLADGSLFPATGELNFADLALQPATGTQQLRAQLRNP